jgi:hypothetical protein
MLAGLSRRGAVNKMNVSTFIDFIKARWRMIAILAVVSLIAILVLLFLVGLLLLPSEMTQSSGVLIFWDQ